MLIVAGGVVPCREYLVLNPISTRRGKAAGLGGESPPLRGGHLLAEGGWEEVHGAIVNDPTAGCVSSRYLFSPPDAPTYPGQYLRFS
jgi:hypothetical protein